MTAIAQAVLARLWGPRRGEAAKASSNGSELGARDAQPAAVARQVGVVQRGDEGVVDAQEAVSGARWRSKTRSLAAA